MWHHYTQQTSAIIYVVDSSDVERLDEAKSELLRVLKEIPHKISLLVFANKQDIPGAKSTDQVAVGEIESGLWLTVFLRWTK